MSEYWIEIGICLVLFWLEAMLAAMIVWAIYQGIWPAWFMVPPTIFVFCFSWSIWKMRPSVASIRDGGGETMKLIYFVLLVITFPYWFVPVAASFFVFGALWMIGYPIACTVHMLYVRARHGKWVHWQLLNPGE